MTRTTAAALASLLLGLLSCQKQIAKGPTHTPAKVVTFSKYFTLTLSSGGGFAGLYQGCTLTSQGEVKAWQKRTGAPESITWTIQEKPDSIFAFAEALEPYLALDLKETGNMTMRIQLELPDTTHQWSISGSGPSAEAPEPFRTWYVRAAAYCHDLAPAP